MKKNSTLNSLENYLKGMISKLDIDLDVYLDSTVGIGEHSDISDEILKFLSKRAELHGMLEQIQSLRDLEMV